MLSMFQADSAFALGLVALAAGMGLVVWMRIHKDHTSKFCRGIAYTVVILALLTLICTGYYTIKYWVSGCFSNPCMMMQSSKNQMMMQRCSMMKNMKNMKNMPMMQNGKQMMNQGKMMNQKMQPMQNSAMKPASKKMPASAWSQAVHHPGQ